MSLTLLYSLAFSHLPGFIRLIFSSLLPSCATAQQAKKGLHPLLYRITVIGTQGGTFPLLSTVQEKTGKFFLTVDQDTHSLWSGKETTVIEASGSGRRGTFGHKFDFLSARSKPKSKSK